jgi:hypothetical protein
MHAPVARRLAGRRRGVVCWDGRRGADLTGGRGVLRIGRRGGMVYATVSKTVARKGLWVRVPPPAPTDSLHSRMEGYQDWPGFIPIGRKQYQHRSTDGAWNNRRPEP